MFTRGYVSENVSLTRQMGRSVHNLSKLSGRDLGEIQSEATLELNESGDPCDFFMFSGATLVFQGVRANIELC